MRIKKHMQGTQHVVLYFCSISVNPKEGNGHTSTVPVPSSTTAVSYTSYTHIYSGSTSQTKRESHSEKNMPGSIVYTEQGENHRHMVLHGGSYSAYTLL